MYEVDNGMAISNTLDEIVGHYAISAPRDDSGGNAFVHAEHLERQSYVDARREDAEVLRPPPLFSPRPTLGSPALESPNLLPPTPAYRSAVFREELEETDMPIPTPPTRILDCRAENVIQTPETVYSAGIRSVSSPHSPFAWSPETPARKSTKPNLWQAADIDFSPAAKAKRVSKEPVDLHSNDDEEGNPIRRCKSNLRELNNSGTANVPSTPQQTSSLCSGLGLGVFDASESDASSIKEASENVTIRSTNAFKPTIVTSPSYRLFPTINEPASPTPNATWMSRGKAKEKVTQPEAGQNSSEPGRSIELYQYPANGITANPATGITVNPATGITVIPATGITVNPVLASTLSTQASSNSIAVTIPLTASNYGSGEHLWLERQNHRSQHVTHDPFWQQAVRTGKQTSWTLLCISAVPFWCFILLLFGAGAFDRSIVHQFGFHSRPTLWQKRIAIVVSVAEFSAWIGLAA
jgi:hypothetical protein